MLALCSPSTIVPFTMHHFHYGVQFNHDKVFVKRSCSRIMARALQTLPRFHFHLTNLHIGICFYSKRFHTRDTPALIWWNGMK